MVCRQRICRGVTKGTADSARGVEPRDGVRWVGALLGRFLPPCGDGDGDHGRQSCARSGAEFSGAGSSVKKWMGAALLPQAGVAIGMALVASNQFPEYRQVLLSSCDQLDGALRNC